MFFSDSNGAFGSQDSEEVGAGFVFHSGEESLENEDAGLGEAACGVEANVAGEMLEAAAQGSNGVRKAREAGIAADLADGPQDTDGPQLLEDVGVTEDDRLRGGWLVFGLVLAHDLKDGGDFLFREARVAQDLGGMGAGVRDVIPAGEIVGIFRAIADEDA